MSRFVIPLIAVAAVSFLGASIACQAALEVVTSPAGAAGPVAAPPGSPAPENPAPEPAAGAPTSPGGCTRGLSLATSTGATAVRQIVSAGLVREFRVHVPARALAGEPFPVVLNFHGRGSNAAEQEALSGLIPISDREGFLLVSPDGTGSPRGWSAGASLPGWPTDDHAFVADLLLALERDFCVDAGRIYATGFSNGAFMASRLACLMGDSIAAVAAVAGAHYPDDVCGRPVPLLAIHGTADAVVPFGPGLVRETCPYRGARGEVAAWAAQNRCTGPVSSALDAAGNVTVSYSECAAETSLVEIPGAQHTWPVASGLGATVSAESIWGFFASKRLAAP